MLCGAHYKSYVNFAINCSIPCTNPDIPNEHLRVYLNWLDVEIVLLIRSRSAVSGTGNIKFLVYTFIDSFIWSAGLAYGGYLLGKRCEQIGNVMRSFDPLILAIILMLIALYIYRHIRYFKLENEWKD